MVGDGVPDALGWHLLVEAAWLALDADATDGALHLAATTEAFTPDVTVFRPQRWDALRTPFGHAAWQAVRATTPTTMPAAADLVCAVVGPLTRNGPSPRG